MIVLVKWCTKMLRDEAIAVINQRLVRTETVLAAAALQQAQIIMESGGHDPWFLETSSLLVTVAGNRSVILPLTFMREIDGDPLTYVDSQGTEQEVEKADPWTSLPRTNGVGPPRHYYLRGTELVVLPTPDASYTLKLPYIQKAQVLTANIENLWLKYAPFWLIGVAGAMRATDVQDKNAQTWFIDMGATGRQAAESATSARRHSNHIYHFGGRE